MRRWKQRDIHEKRELRKLKLVHFGLETTMNESLLGRIRSLLTATEAEGALFVARKISELRAVVPNFENPEKLGDGEQPSEDHMVLSLLVQVVNGAQKREEKDATVALVAELKEHEARLIERQAEIVKEQAAEEKEQQRHITSDDIHVGFNSKTVSLLEFDRFRILTYSPLHFH